MQPIVVSGFVIRAHGSDSLYLGSSSLFIGVAGRMSILCGGFNGLSPPFPPLLSPSTFQCLSVICVMSACLLRIMGAHGWVFRICQPLGQSPSWS